MKKINYILCAMALSGAVMFVSCKQEAPQYNFVTSETTKNQYSVTGTITTVVANKTVNSEGTAGTTDRKSTTVKSISAGYATVSWTDSKVLEGNASNDYSIEFSELRGTAKTEVKAGETEVTPFPTELTTTDQTLSKIVLNKIDDAFFFVNPDGKFEKVPVDNLESGADFTLSYSYSTVVDNAGYVASDSKVVNTTTTTITYNLTFKAK